MLFIFAAALLVLLLFLLMPQRQRPSAEPFLHRYYAHRGLYSKDQQVPENSLPAFYLARTHGFGVELDVQLSQDKIPVVFHDDTLERACGRPEHLFDLPLSQLQALSLFGTSEHIPTFKDVLGVLDGQVPLIVELKSGPNNALLCETVLPLLRTYTGPLCLESFDPRIVRFFRKQAPDLLRGQLACSYASCSPSAPAPVRFLSSRCLLNFVSRPHFIAYECGRKNALVRLCEHLGALRVLWTSHDQKDWKGQDMVIFEHYLPDPVFPSHNVS